MNRVLQLSCLLAVAIPAAAQTSTATISGLVTDPAGAIVSGARIIVTETRRNTALETSSNSSGMFTIPELQPGVYRVRVEMAGFQTYVLEELALSTQQKATVNVALVIGSVSEQVSVTAAAQQLDATSSTLSAVVDNKQIIDLPLNGRKVTDLARMVPGVFSVRQGGLNTSDTQDSIRFIVNGGFESSTDIQLDGVTTQVPSNNNQIFKSSALPSVEGIQEFRIQTNAFSAEYGRTGGGIVTMVTKSGTNTLHGSAFEFLRHHKLDSNNFFANRAGRPLTGFRRNQFGGSIGGPIRIPALYDGRNRSFFFFVYEGERLNQARFVQQTVPTELERKGDFSRSFNRNGQMIAVFDPFSTRPDPARPGRFLRDAFPSNVVPTARLDPVALKMQSYYPLPNEPGQPFTNQLNYVSRDGRIEPQDRYEFKVDHNFNPSRRMFLRYTRLYQDFGPPNIWNNPATSGGSVMYNRMQNAAVDYTETLSPTAVFNLRYGLSRVSQERPGYGYGFDVRSLGLPDSIANIADVQKFPTVIIQDFQQIGGNTAEFYLVGNLSHTLAGSLSRILGRHTLKIGVDNRYHMVNFGQIFDPTGTYRFTRAMTQGPDPRTATANAGIGIASFLLGTGSAGQIQHQIQPALANRYLALYVQDDFKISRRLTLNAGLRWDYETAATERYDRQTAMDPFVTTPPSSSVGRQLYGGYLYAGGTLGRRGIASPYLNMWNPRFGFALELNSRTTIRSGYGIFFGLPPWQPNSYFTGSPFVNATPWVASLDGITPTNLLRNPFPSGFALPQGPGGGLLSGVGYNLATAWADTLQPLYNQQWNLTIQRQLAENLMLEVAYAANKGTHIPQNAHATAYQPNMNQLPEQYLSLGNQLLTLVPNPFFGIITGSSSLGQPTVQLGQLLRPFPQYNVVVPISAGWGNSTYNSLQVRIERRYAQGLSFLGSYTWSKTINDASDGYWNKVDGDMRSWYCRRCDRSLSTYNQPHRFVFNATYELPVGRGRTYFAGISRWADSLLGGWQVNGIFTISQGLPLSFDVPQNTSRSFGGGQLPNSTGISADLGLDQRTIDRWFDTTQFKLPSEFTFGNMSRTHPTLKEDFLRQVDLSLFKSFPLWESTQLQFRAEAFNLTNTPVFGAPGTVLDSGTFGVINGQQNLPRQIQLSLKLIF